MDLLSNSTFLLSPFAFYKNLCSFEFRGKLRYGGGGDFAQVLEDEVIALKHLLNNNQRLRSI